MESRINLDVLLRRPTPQDVIVAIFVYSGLRSFTNNHYIIQRFIRENKTDKTAELLEQFIFSEGVDLYPYSRILEKIMTGLLLGGIVFTWSPGNPRDDSYIIDEVTRQKMITKIEERFSAEQIIVLKELGEKFRRLH